MTEREKINSSSEDTPTRQVSPGAPLIFISHDSRDAGLAEAVSKLLSSVSAGVLKSFRSSDRKGSQGIEYGVEWYPELMRKLESASDVVCLLTQRSLDRPWILYEAGVAKGKLDTPVYGVALGIPLRKANSGPFAQFQNCDDKAESLTKLVLQLLDRVPGSEPDREAVQMQVAAFKTKIDQVLKQEKDVEGSAGLEPDTDSSSVAKLFEEIKVMFQDLPSRVESRVMDSRGPSRRRRLRMIHPEMLYDLTHMASEAPGDLSGLLLISGFLREDYPWIYEFLLDAYREAKAGNIKAARSTLQKLRRVSKVVIEGPFVEEFGAHPREAMMLTMELPELLDRYLRRIQMESKAPRRRPRRIDTPTD